MYPTFLDMQMFQYQGERAVNLVLLDTPWGRGWVLWSPPSVSSLCAWNLRTSLEDVIKIVCKSSLTPYFHFFPLNSQQNSGLLVLVYFKEDDNHINNATAEGEQNT